MDSQTRVQQTLAQQANPQRFVLEKLYARAFGTEQALESSLYSTLNHIEPVLVGDNYKGDAQDFLNNSVQGPYANLQHLVKRLAESVAAQPFPGEHITAFVERIAAMATNQAQQ